MRPHDEKRRRGGGGDRHGFNHIFYHPAWRIKPAKPLCGESDPRGTVYEFNHSGAAQHVHGSTRAAIWATTYYAATAAKKHGGGDHLLCGKIGIMRPRPPTMRHWGKKEAKSRQNSYGGERGHMRRKGPPPQKSITARPVIAVQNHTPRKTSKNHR